MGWSLSRLWKRTLLQISLVLLVLGGSYIIIGKNPLKVANMVNSIEDLTGASIVNQWEEDIHVLTDVAWKECTYYFGFYKSCSINVKYKNQEQIAKATREDVQQRIQQKQQSRNAPSLKREYDSDQTEQVTGENENENENENDELKSSIKDDVDDSGHVKFYGTVIPKDLYLGQRWFKKLSLVSINTEIHTAANHDIDVVEDIVIFNPSVNKEYVGQNLALELYLSKHQIPFKVHKQVAGTSGVGATTEELNYYGWFNAGYGLWVKKGSKISSESMTDLNILFGRQSVDPRNGWESLPVPLPITDVKSSRGKLETRAEMNITAIDYHQFDSEAYVFYKPRRTKKITQVHPTIRSDGKFKILQLADLHFSTGFGKCMDPWPEFEGNIDHCLADMISLDFVNAVLDIEKPDLVVLSGDQIFGEASPDSETALYKVVKPLVDRKISYAAVFGNHDDEGGSLDRAHLMELLESLPYSVSQAGPEEISGVGNYVLDVRSSAKSTPIVMYFLDSHSYPKGKIRGYDWIKEDQIHAVKSYHEEVKDKEPIELAFFQIPLQEYVPTQDQIENPSRFLGSFKEGVMAGAVNTGMYSTLRDIGVKFLSVGHDHCNDYCMKGDGTEDKDGVWMCYGGAAGEGGYGGYGGTSRRVRVFEVDTNTNSVQTWSRYQTDPEEIQNLLSLD